MTQRSYARRTLATGAAVRTVAASESHVVEPYVRGGDGRCAMEFAAAALAPQRQTFSDT